MCLLVNFVGKNILMLNLKFDLISTKKNLYIYSLTHLKSNYLSLIIFVAYKWKKEEVQRLFYTF